MKRKSTYQRAAIAALAILGLLGCRGGQTSQQDPHKQRVISLSPGVTEIVYGVGAFSSLVADSQYCDYPAAAKDLPHVGSFYAVNLEAVAALQPDLVIIIEDQAIFFKDKLEKLGVRVLPVKSRSIADIIGSIRIIGRETGHEAEGEKLAAEVEQRINERKHQTAGLNQPRVLWSVDHLPGTLKDVNTATGGSFLDELITIGGGRNVAPSDVHGYSKIQQEAVVEANPEVIFDVVHVPNAKLGGNPKAVWQALPQVDAVRNDRVYIITNTDISHPSQRILDALDTVCRIIHPEVFGKYEQ